MPVRPRRNCEQTESSASAKEFAITFSDTEARLRLENVDAKLVVNQKITAKLCDLHRKAVMLDLS